MQQEAREIKNKISPTCELSPHQQIAPGKKEQSCQLFLCRIGITWASKDMVIVDPEVVRSLLSEKSHITFLENHSSQRHILFDKSPSKI